MPPGQTTESPRGLQQNLDKVGNLRSVAQHQAQLFLHIGERVRFLVGVVALVHFVRFFRLSVLLQRAAFR